MADTVKVGKHKRSRPDQSKSNNGSKIKDVPVKGYTRRKPKREK